ncbi:hypothetical protein OS31_27710 [Dickeya oryzae]
MRFFCEAEMQRLTISLDDPLAEALDALMLRKGYANRSEAFRDMLRRELGEMTVAQDKKRRVCRGAELCV